MGKNAYRRLARVYDPFCGPMNAALRSLAMKMFPPRGGMRMLDVGCGTGSTLDPGATLISSDPRIPNLYRLERRGRVGVARGG